MTENEAVALTPTSELQTMPMTHQSRNSEYALDVDKSNVSQWDAIVNDIDAAEDAICELADIETMVAGIPITLTLDMVMGKYTSYKVKVIALIEGKETPINLAAQSPKLFFGDRLDEETASEVFKHIRSPEFKKELEIRNKAAKRYNDAVEAKKAYGQSQFKAFEGITIPKGYHFEGVFAHKVETYTTFDDGKEVTTEKYQTIGNCCAVTTRYRVDGTSKVMLRIRFITLNGDIKDVDVEVGVLNDLRSLNEFAREHGLRISKGPAFMDMLDVQLNEGVKNNKLPILDATTKLGWYNDVYVCGQECYGGDVICVDAKLCEMYYKEGTLDGYMEGIKGLVNIPEVRLAMGIVVAAMLLSLVGVASFSVSLYGGTSNAKTLRWLLALAMFGNPLRIKMNFNHSAQATNQRLTHIRGAALLMDEIKEEKEREEAQRLVKETSDGVTREVLYFRTGKNESHTQSAILVFTSERPLFDEATYGGTRVRCMVLKTRENFPFLKDEVRAFERLVSPKSTTDINPKNFGHLGPMIYDVIRKHPNIRDEFDAIKDQFEPKTAIENRIADMQAVTALGMELLEEVFDSIRGAYPWLERMDSVQVVKDQTADYVDESTVPEWEPQLQHLLSKIDFDRRYLDPDAVIVTDDEGNKTEHKKEGTYPVKGYLTKIKGEDFLALNGVETDAYIKKNGMDPETIFSGVRNNTEILKTYEKKNKKGKKIKGGLKIQNPQKDSIPGGMVYALSIDRLREWFKDHDAEEEEAEEEPIDVSAELEAINAREKDNLSLLRKHYTYTEKVKIAMPAKTYEDSFMEKIDNFILWYEVEGKHTHEEAVQKADELKSRIKLKQDQLAFYNSNMKRNKAKEWTPTIELFWINNK